MDNNLEDKKVKFHYDKQFTIRFLDRSIRFLTYSLLALITLYIFSDSQNFLDESFFLILHVMIGLCILLVLFSFTAVLFKLFYMVKYKEKKHLFSLIANIILLFFSLFAAVFFSILIVAAKGNLN